MMNRTILFRQRLTWLNTLRGTCQPTPTQQRTLDGAQAQQFQAAFHRAYRRFAQTYPAWTKRGFDEAFLRQAIQPRRARAPRTEPRLLALPTNLELAWAWDKQFGPLTSPAGRTGQIAELLPIATAFLHMFAAELEPLARVPG